MTKEEIIEMARHSGAMFDHITWVERDLLPVFERFAKLVAEKEREECAKICDDMDSISDYYTLRVELICAQAIRARGQE
jgi:hypothetical protein